MLTQVIEQDGLSPIEKGEDKSFDGMLSNVEHMLEPVRFWRNLGPYSAETLLLKPGRSFMVILGEENVWVAETVRCIFGLLSFGSILFDFKSPLETVKSILADDGPLIDVDRGPEATEVKLNKVES